MKDTEANQVAAGLKLCSINQEIDKSTSLSSFNTSTMLGMGVRGCPNLKLEASDSQRNVTHQDVNLLC